MPVQWAEHKAEEDLEGSYQTCSRQPISIAPDQSHGGLSRDGQIKSILLGIAVLIRLIFLTFRHTQSRLTVT